MIVNGGDVLLGLSEYTRMLLHFKRLGCTCGSLPASETGSCDVCLWTAKKLAELNTQITTDEIRRLREEGAA